MNIVTRLAIIERLLEDAAPQPNGQVTAAPLQPPTRAERRLVDDLDQAQILKAAAYLRPSRHASV